MHSKEFELIDGRVVRQTPSGRYQDKRTGKWLSKKVVLELRIAKSIEENQDTRPMLSPRDYVFQAMQQAARKHGYPVESLEEAWGKVMQVQAEIALDKSNAAKATAAARMLAQATGIMEEPEADQDEQTPWFVLGRKLAWEMLFLIREEKTCRESED